VPVTPGAPPMGVAASGTRKRARPNSADAAAVPPARKTRSSAASDAGAPPQEGPPSKQVDEVREMIEVARERQARVEQDID